MPLDPVIAAGFQGVQLPNPLEGYARVMQIQQAQQQNALARMTMERAQREEQVANRLRSLDPTAPNYQTEVMRINPELGSQLMLRSKQQTQAERAAAASEAELRGKNLTYWQGLARDSARTPTDDVLVGLARRAVELGIADEGTAASQLQQIIALPPEQRSQVLSQFGSQAAVPAAAKEPQLTAEQREYNLAKEQGFKGTFMEYKQALKPAPAQVSVKLPEQEKEFEKALGSGQAKKLLDDKIVADDARSIIDTVQQGRRLLQSGMITGFGAETLTQLGAALNQAGIKFAEEPVANTQAFSASMAANVGRIIKQFGAGTGLSNADREYAEKMAGGKVTLDRKAIERILDINERAARNVIAAHNKRAAGVKTNVPLMVEAPPAEAPAAAPQTGRPSLDQIFKPRNK